MPQPIANLGKLPPYLFAELDRKIAQAKAKGVDVISLGVGDPDLPTPAPIVKALQEAVADPSTHNYSSYTGTDEFRRAAADWMRERFGVEIDPSDEVIALIGSKEGLAHLILTYIAEGDVTLYPSPAYPVYRNFTLLCGGEPVAVPLLPENEFLPDLDAISPDAAKRAKLLFLNYPNNPTGAIAPESFIKKAIEFCTRHDILLCHDNAYSEMTFDGYKAPSFLSVPGAKDVCIEMFSTSKMYNMTGWRIGFAAGNNDASQRQRGRWQQPHLDRAGNCDRRPDNPARLRLGIVRIVVLSQHFDISAQGDPANAIFRFADLLFDKGEIWVEEQVELLNPGAKPSGRQEMSEFVQDDEQGQAGDQLQDLDGYFHIDFLGKVFSSRNRTGGKGRQSRHSMRECTFNRSDLWNVF